MSDYLLPIFILVVVAVWWLSSHSLVGSVARTPETDAALAVVAEQVAQSLKSFNLGEYKVAPVWAHGCPCVRVSLADSGAAVPPDSHVQARKAAEAALEDAVRASPAFAHIAKKYRGEQGLHWY